MTNENIDAGTVLAVAVPYYEETMKLAEKWCGYKRIVQAGISFVLVSKDGRLKFYPDEIIASPEMQS